MAKKYSLRRLYFKIIQQEGTPTSIGRGVAIGLSIGFVLPIGLQTLPALALAFLFRANKVLAWLFTCVSNPATVLLLYPLQCYIGSLVLFHPLRLSELNNKFHQLCMAGTFANAWHSFIALGANIIIPFFVGGLLLALLSAPLGYWISYRLVEKYRARKERKRLKKLQKNADLAKIAAEK